MQDVTRILRQIDQGDPSASAQLLPLVYAELRQLAAAKLAGEKPGQTLQPTALVHEAYLRLVGDGTPVNWNGRGHFFGATAEAMRRILVDVARSKSRQKRGGDWERVSVLESDLAQGIPVDDVLAVDELLEDLAKADSPAAELVKLRYFSGLSTEEAAEILQISPRSAYRDWQFARAWLNQRISRD